VARHERLRVRVGVHLRPQRLRQVAPDVLHHLPVYDLGVLRPVAALAGVVTGLRLRLRALLLLALRHLAVPLLAAPLRAHLPGLPLAGLRHLLAALLPPLLLSLLLALLPLLLLLLLLALLLILILLLLLLVVSAAPAAGLLLALADQRV